MNGFSLLLLLSSIGATTSVETGLNGQPLYTIRIESLLINELRNGQTIPILVAPKDRRIRQFKIAISDLNPRSNAGSRASDVNSRAGDLFLYEPTLLENGEIEYVVQISPERLESLAAGKPIEGEIASEVTDVHRFLIFVGIGQLPSQQQAVAQQQAAASAANGNPPSLLRGVGAEVRAAPGSQPRNSNTPLTKTPFQTGTQQNGTQQTGTQRGFQANDPLTQFNTRSNDARTNWRNQPDQSTINPPPFANLAQQPNTSGSTYPRSLGVPAATDRNAYAQQPPYNNQYQQPNYADPNSVYGQQNPANYPQQNFPANPGINYQQQPGATVAGRTEVPTAVTSTMPTNPGWAQPPTANQTAAQPPTASATVPTTSTKESERERPWTPLILTTLALFASLGANAYLGWLSWSFFWRFRDAVTESARTRAQISSSRQAA